MTTKSFTVQRNYRISNDDQYAKALFSQDVVPEENETTEDAALRAIKQMDNIFRMAYPHVAEHLNFHIARDYSNKLSDAEKWTKMPSEWDTPKNIEVESPLQKVKTKSFNLPSDAEFYSRNDNLNLPTTIPEKINKGTIEEQIQACTTLEELKSFKVISGMNIKYKAAYDLKMKEFANPELKTKTV